MVLKYPLHPPQGFQEPPPPYSEEQPRVMMTNMGMHSPPPAYSSYPAQQMPLGAAAAPMMAPGPSQASYAHQIPPTAFPLGGGSGFHNIPLNGNTSFLGPHSQKSPTEAVCDFSNKTIRLAFIRKLYSILTVQMLITVSFIALFLYQPSLNEWTRRTPQLFFAAMTLTLISLLVMAFWDGVRRKPVQHFVCLLVLTLASGVMVGTAASIYQFNQYTILLSASVIALVCGALTLFSYQTKVEFTGRRGIVLVGCIDLLIFGLVITLGSGMFPMVQLLYSFVGVLMFSAYLVWLNFLYGPG